MNAVPSLPRTICPACAKPLVCWPRTGSIYYCHHCERPLARYPTSWSPRIYRIMPFFDVARVMVTIGGGSALLWLLLVGGSTGAIAVTIAVMLAIFGASDATDGYLAIKTRIDRGRSGVLEGDKARTRGWAKMVFGGATCLVGAIGLIAVRALA